MRLLTAIGSPLKGQLKQNYFFFLLSIVSSSRQLLRFKACLSCGVFLSNANKIVLGIQKKKKNQKDKIRISLQYMLSFPYRKTQRLLGSASWLVPESSAVKTCLPACDALGSCGRFRRRALDGYWQHALEEVTGAYKLDFVRRWVPCGEGPNPTMYFFHGGLHHHRPQATGLGDERDGRRKRGDGVMTTVRNSIMEDGFCWLDLGIRERKRSSQCFPSPSPFADETHRSWQKWVPGHSPWQTHN